jgi:hypothetical protein
VPVGSQAQTVPDPGAQPATFETVAAIPARAEWNTIGVRQTRPISANPCNVFANLRLQGQVSTVKVGDTLLVVVGATSASAATMQTPAQLNRVAAVTFDTTNNTTLVQFEWDYSPILAELPAGGPPTPPATASLNDTFLWAYVKGQKWPDQTQLTAYATTQGWSIDDLEDAINALQGSLQPGATPPVTVYTMGTDAALFGHNAPDYTTVTFPKKETPPSPWNGDTIASNATTALPSVDLDTVYPVTVGDQVALITYPSGSWSWEVFFSTVTDVAVVTRCAYLLSSKVTTINLAGQPASPADYTLRETRVLIETPPALTVADVVLTRPVQGGRITLDGAYLSLTVGQQLAVTGALADRPGVTASEAVAIAGLELVDGYTVISCDPQLTGSYVRSSVTVNANVAPATHGVTTTQILGSGDSSQTFQSFALNQTPLTYVSAATPSGAASTMTVTVDGVEWTAVDWLYGSQPTDSVYTVLTGADGNTYVQFGDGVTGARPHTGTNNIVATYRYGIGSVGLARPGQISTLLSRSVVGLNAVTNPVASAGAADPEMVSQARTNAPVSVMTLGRIVSLDDVADFAAASAGIAKAAVNWIWDGTRFVACATVAGIGGSPVTPGTSQYTNLLAAMVGASDGTLPVALCSYQSMTFTVGAAITPDPAQDSSQVLAGVQSALAGAFSFDNRAFGQPVFASEVIDVAQNAPGVVAVTLTTLDYSGGAAARPALPAPAATLGPQGLIGATLLTLESGTLPGVVIAS